MKRINKTEEIVGGYFFFSIIIPAHNEEQYISNTLDYVVSLDYPKYEYEVIVIENGSTDNTLRMIERYKTNGVNYQDGGSIVVKVFSIGEKGVSKAKNFGIEKTSPHSDWVIFLDADTILKKSFLTNLNAFLKEKASKHLVVGTTSVLPIKSSNYARAWFGFYNLGHWLIQASFSIQIVKRSVLDTIKFDKCLSYAEDLKIIRESQRIGRFFFFWTEEVYTSTRRFDKEGWFKLFFKWLFRGLLPNNLKKKVRYEVIR